MGLQLDDEGSDSDQSEEKINYIKYLIESIENMSTNFNFTKRNVKFSAHILNMAMPLFMRNKKLYNDLCDSGLLYLLHLSTLKKY